MLGRTGLPSPTLAVTSGGTVWMTAEEGDATWLAASADGERTFVDPTRLATAWQLSMGGGVTPAAGTSDGQVRASRME
ncbi:MAG: hypothetical protein ACOZNI_00755 [Myxococcota bacterium]